MKKTVSALLAIIMTMSVFFCFTACGGGSNGPKTTGAYVLTSMKQGDTVLDSDTLASIGADKWNIRFKSDGKGTATFGDEGGEFTWDDKSIKSSDTTLTYKLDGDKLTVSDGEATMEFTYNANF
ncbi:MAG: lipocalin family protein [Acutalibacteraceae bacterium]